MKGSISVGKLEEDLYSTPVEKIKDLRIVRTVVAGGWFMKGDGGRLPGEKATCGPQETIVRRTEVCQWLAKRRSRRVVPLKVVRPKATAIHSWRVVRPRSSAGRKILGAASLAFAAKYFFDGGAGFGVVDFLRQNALDLSQCDFPAQVAENFVHVGCLAHLARNVKDYEQSARVRFACAPSLLGQAGRRAARPGGTGVGRRVRPTGVGSR